jgi:protein involved in polysaccharide export with SLBB domain
VIQPIRTSTRALLAALGIAGALVLVSPVAQGQSPPGRSVIAPRGTQLLGRPEGTESKELARRIPLAGAGAGLEGALGGSYQLGPGDSLAVGIWGPSPITYPLVVTLEGTVIVPAVGELHVDGLTLEEARAQIRKDLLTQFHNVDITISLIGLRRFQVHVLGQVTYPGTYLATAVDRVSASVGWAGDFLPNAGQRNIAVMSGDSVRAHADLFAFLRRGIDLNNPRLHDGDIVYVPYARDRFSVMGAVNEPRTFEYLQGDAFSEALSYAGGFAADAFPDTIEVARYLGPDRHPVRFYVIAGGGIVAARSADEPHVPTETGRFPVHDFISRGDEMLVYADFELQPDDIIFVRAIPEYRIKRLVEVEGEVIYPGQYPINEGETRISDIIRRAGGVTDEAFLKEATLVRREAIRLEDKEFERLKTVPPADMTRDEYEYFKLRSRENRGLMVVDFHELLVEGDQSQDLLLRHGDLISIPKTRGFVSVLGMVAAPGNVIFEEGLTGQDYLRRVGGFAENADRRRTRVIRAATGEWVSLNEADRILTGDTIWVPEKQDRDYWALFRDFITVTTQIVTIYLVVDTAVGPR